MMISEIRYGKATLPESCCNISRHLPEPYHSCFLQIYERMKENTGVVFGQVFAEQMEECLATLPLEAEDKKCFQELFSDDSFEDGNMQIRSIEQSKEVIEHTIRRLEKENAEKCRMAVGLGAMSGLLLVIILL